MIAQDFLFSGAKQFNEIRVGSPPMGLKTRVG